MSPSRSASSSRSAIVEAATIVFARQGLAATSVQDLLQGANVSRRTFYKSFPNKEAVLAAIYEERTSGLMTALRDARGAAAAGDAAAALDLGLELYFGHHLLSGPLVLVFIEEARRSGSLLAERRQALRTELMDFISEGARDANGRPPDPLLMIALLSALEGVSLQILRNGVTDEALCRAKKVMRQLLQDALAPFL